MDSNNNDTEVPEDQPEEQALQLNVKDFAYRSKAKAKPQRREPAGYSPKFIRVNARNSIDIEPGKHYQNQFPQIPHSLTIVGKHAWQQEEEQKDDSSTVLMIQELLFISELFKDIQDAILFIFHCRTML